MQLALLGTRICDSRDELATAKFSWVEGWYDPRRRHSGLGYRSPAEYEKIHTQATGLAA